MRRCNAPGTRSDLNRRHLKAIVDGEGIRIIATHTELCSGCVMNRKPSLMIINCGDVNTLQSVDLPGEYRTTEGYARFAREASEVAARLAEGGLTFSYHNHSFELERYNGRTGLEILYAESDPKYFKSELDTYWIQHGGGDPDGVDPSS